MAHYVSAASARRGRGVLDEVWPFGGAFGEGFSTTSPAPDGFLGWGAISIDHHPRAFKGA